MDDPILQVNKLTVSFSPHSDQRAVVRNLSFSVSPGKIMGLVGESGSGKSMTALAVMQLLPFGAFINSDAQVLFAEQDLLTLSERKMREVRGIEIGMVFQDAMSAFNPVLTVAQQMDEVLRKLKLGAVERKERALTLLDEVGIKEVKRTYQSYPHELSGGMRQRAMIAQALCGEPKLVIADEPTTALDVTIQAQVINLLLKLRETRNLSLLFITHDLAVISQIADDVLVMKKGELVEASATRVFFQNPQHDYSKRLIDSIPSNEVVHRANDSGQSLLALQDLKVYFEIKGGGFSKSTFKAVDGINFSINQGETLALVGESGSGKTTAAKAIMRLIKSTAGKIEFENVDLVALSSRKMKPMRRDIQIIFQDPYVSLNPRCIIADSILEGVRAQKLVRGRKKQLELVDSLLLRVGLKKEHKWRYPHEFSGGERQRICIARALALRPKLLILDEPTSALDVSIQMQVLNLLKEVQVQYNIAYLLITHNVSVVAYLAHHLAVMYHGEILEQGEAHSVLTNPQHEYTQSLLKAVPTIEEAHDVRAD